ncbi:hypothetical protein P7K49_013556 [Saguinus oedipus]|uniref:Uncharacterized protein n=1 Tax=Saguinus oedipus TaxID=9490 RepID=A0ABQ9VGG3_SAGOE|nr:hypothetical protein P7K49_013556 [Saguinus oedipus]
MVICKRVVKEDGHIPVNTGPVAWVLNPKHKPLVNSDLKCVVDVFIMYAERTGQENVGAMSFWTKQFNQAGISLQPQALVESNHVGMLVTRKIKDREDDELHRESRTPITLKLIEWGWAVRKCIQQIQEEAELCLENENTLGAGGKPVRWLAATCGRGWQSHSLASLPRESRSRSRGSVTIDKALAQTNNAFHFDQNRRRTAEVSGEVLAIRVISPVHELQGPTKVQPPELRSKTRKHSWLEGKLTSVHVKFNDECIWRKKSGVSYLDKKLLANQNP